MGLMKTLVNVAVGVAIAKGMQAMTGRSGGGSTRTAGGGGLGGGLAGGLGGAITDMLGGGSGTTPARQPGRGTPYGRGADRGGLEDMMGDILGTGRGAAAAPASRTQSNARNPRKNAPKGGLDDLVTGNASGGGGFGELLGGLAGGTIGAATAPRTLPEPREETLAAAVLLRCMVQAAKCDGDLGEDEKAKLMEAMGDAEKAEIDFVNAELKAAVDVDSLARQIPNGMEEKAYLVSLMAINLDQQNEAEYLHRLATALELSQDDVNALHDKLNAPRIYN